MVDPFLIAVGWPAGAGVELWSRAFWIHQAVSAAGTAACIWWIARVAGRNARGQTAMVIRFPRMPRPPT